MKAKHLIISCLGIILFASAVCAEVSLTVYQRDLVLIRDTREVDLSRGINKISFTDIAPAIYESTLRINPTKNTKGISTVEQSYEYDLADRDRIWKKFLGKHFEFTKDDSLYSGILLNFDDDRIYLELEDQPGSVALVSRSGIEDMTFESLPEGLVLHPEVVWTVNSSRKRSNVEVEISYLADGMTWQADYTAYLRNSDRIQLEGNITLTNSLDMDFQDVSLDMIAGDPHRSYDRRPLGGEDEFGVPGVIPSEKETRFFEYRRYSLPERTDLHASQTKGVPFITVADVSCEKAFFYDGSSSEEEVLVRLTFENLESSGLGIGLPEGDLLLYQFDDDRVQFLGEDHLEASSPGDEVELIIGKAFDLRVDRKRVSHQRISRNRTRDTIEITFVSSRDSNSKITVRERLYGFWEIMESAWGDDPASFRTVHSNKVEFDLEISPGESKTLRYVVEYGY
ncbi:hypothetical protein CEE37_09730 [candidate division LCP-89 bacterium B3_LCP]|uniref:Uncharacterized protein n=1 Tax=candidate division LCP-89 bacterium B3_LCP TaxID=2012998 RepID=A0A532UYK6_UNCL8|nr:MAG: hypothetical protein CEE37_09730 [candidate division LCP-89 bacterium B3_LCP]